MKNWTIKQRILGSFGLILLLMAVMAGISAVNLGRIEKSATACARIRPRPVLQHQINAAWYENLLMTQQIIQIDTSEAERQADLALLRRNAERLDRLQEDYDKTIFSDDDRKLFEQFKETRQKYRAMITEV
jgi:methyl-accepting chemotaxis protein WspA